jgi:hypothetical protein
VQRRQPRRRSPPGYAQATLVGVVEGLLVARFRRHDIRRGHCHVQIAAHDREVRDLRVVRGDERLRLGDERQCLVDPPASIRPAPRTWSSCGQKIGGVVWSS